MNSSYVSSLSAVNPTVVSASLWSRASDSHVNYYSDNRRSCATKREICPTCARRRFQEKERERKRDYWTSVSFDARGCVQLRETTKRDRPKESPTPCTLSPASLELTRNYAITSAIRMPRSGLVAAASAYICARTCRVTECTGSV